MSADDEIRIFEEGWRLIGHYVQAELIARGWAVTDLAIADDEPLEFFWPPTAPVGYGGLPEPTDAITQRFGPFERRTPWIAPTRITRDDEHWRVDFGEATAQEPAPSRTYADGQALLADVERIEWWPMTVDEATRIQMERIFSVTVAAARDDHTQASTITEPYASQLKELSAHLGGPKPNTPRPRGNLSAQMQLIEAASWASAIRTERAGGEDCD